MVVGFRTLASEFRYEDERVKGSRFLATLAPVADADEALAFVERVRAEFADASHNCWAFRVGGKGEVFRSSDDGEPGGSAGRPILQQIEGHDVTNVAVVVTRWFGGTKLGVGGLMRAYGGAAGHALDRAELRTVVITRRIVLEYPYECSGPMEGLFAAHALAPLEAEYGEAVRVTLEVPEHEADAFVAEARDRSAGRVRVAPNV